MKITYLLAFVLVAATSVDSMAQQNASSSVPKAGTAPTASNEADRIQALQQFWTPERLASARPLPIPKATPTSSVPNTSVQSGPARSGLGGRPTIQDPAGQASSEDFQLNQGDDSQDDATAVPTGFNYIMPFSNYRPGGQNTYPHTTVGKLFFTIPSGTSEPPGTYVCSGAVAIDNHTVVTARHCVFDYVSNKFYSNWVFYPGWQNGKDNKLHGAWYPNYVVTWVSDNTDGLTTGWDIAMMTMHDSTNTGCGGDRGRTIGQYTGWLGYTYGGDYSQRQWNIFGYPQASPFEGNYLYQDNGATGIVNPFGSSNVVEVGNPQTGGTSGGPWVIGLDPGGAADVYPTNNVNPSLTNLINGVNSFIWTNPSEPWAINGTIFQQSNFWNLYTYLKGQPCS